MRRFTRRALAAAAPSRRERSAPRRRVHGSSPIVHAPPSKLAILALKVLDESFKIGRGIKASMEPMPGSRKAYIARRNFMRLLGDAEHRITAEWWVEHPDGEKVFRKVTHPVG